MSQGAEAQSWLGAPTILLRVTELADYSNGVGLEVLSDSLQSTQIDGMSNLGACLLSLSLGILSQVPLPY